MLQGSLTSQEGYCLQPQHTGNQIPTAVHWVFFNTFPPSGSQQFLSIPSENENNLKMLQYRNNIYGTSVKLKVAALLTSSDLKTMNMGVYRHGAFLIGLSILRQQKIPATPLNVMGEYTFEKLA